MKAASPARKLLPVDPLAQASDLQTLGFILAAGEKAVQNVYEHNLRPAEKQHNPWIERITIQLLAACRGVEYPAGKPSGGRGPRSGGSNEYGNLDIYSVDDPHVVHAGDFNHIQSAAELYEAHSAFKNIPLVKLKEMKLNTQHESPRRPIAPGTRGRAETVQRGGKD